MDSDLALERALLLLQANLTVIAGSARLFRKVRQPPESRAAR
jgi:hypothetical protein